MAVTKMIVLCIFGFASIQTVTATVNLALGRPAFQSSTYSGYYFASLAVDGNADSNFDHKHCAHGDDIAAGPNWLAVDLGRSYPIHQVVLTNRNCHPYVCANRLDYFQVRVTNTSPTEQTPDKMSTPNCGRYPNQTFDGERLTVACHKDTPPGRYVIIQQPPGGKGWLTICEMEVYAFEDATYQQLQEKYIGCFEDKDGERDVKGASMTLTGSLTVDLCIEKCTIHQFTYAAVQDSSRCFCDNRYGQYGKFDTSMCISRCDGDRRQICGGVLKNNIYTVCPRGTFGPRCSQTCHCADGKACYFVDGTCPSGCSDGWTGSICNEPVKLLPSWIWAIIVIAIVVFLIIACIIGWVLIRSRSCSFFGKVSTVELELNSIQNCCSLQEASFPVPTNNNYLLTPDRGCAEYYVGYDDTENNNSRPGIAFSELRKYVDKYKDTFKKEFEAIPMESQASRSLGKLTHLKSKNRFQNITPYDHNRVVLKNPDNTAAAASSDYINASLITGFDSEKIVATQGPKENTVDDFWRMVYQLETRVIVMLCNPEENGKENSKQYWPDSESEIFGYITVTLLKEQIWPNFICRHLRATKKSSEPLNIVQWQFTAWPEQGVPENARTILSFRRKVRQSIEKNRYTVIHCSAGAGRTGTFLAIDYLMEEARLEKYVDVPGCVRLLREERPRMVPTLSKYEFIYTTLVAHASTGDTTCSTKDFKDYHENLLKAANGKTNSEKQFEILLEETNGDASYNDGQKSSPENIDSDSVIVPSIKCKESYIISNVSKPVRAEDYWSNLPENCTTFVLLDCNNIFEQVFPTEDRIISDSSTILLIESASTVYGTCFKIGISVQTEDESIYKNTSDDIYKNDHCVDDVKEVTVLHVTSPATDVMTLDVVQCLHSELVKVLANNGVISIQYNSRMGSELSLAGFLIAAWNAMEMIENYNEVDIFQISRELRKIEYRLMSDLASYNILHEVILEHSIASNIEHRALPSLPDLV